MDVLVNTAANFYAGFFEELTPEQFDARLQTNLTGPLTSAARFLRRRTPRRSARRHRHHALTGPARPTQERGRPTGRLRRLWTASPPTPVSRLLGSDTASL